jgi:Rrf2 family iron-sulfur cluster assembly transcriptional regulator
MKFTAKTRYGLKAMCYLAKDNKNKPISLNILAKNSEVTAPYLEKLLADLKKAKLIVTTRGAGGGYNLSKPAKDISLTDIVKALEGELVKINCITNCNSKTCPNKNVFEGVSSQITNMFNNISLESIIQNNKEE